MEAEGLRERKKRRTRRHITEVAAGLFVEHGFDHVTIAEVAAAADVSVNTVYNYFETKEDLVLPLHQEQRLADIVRAREPGESAAAAVLAHLRAEVRRRDRALGLTAGYAGVHAMMLAAPTLLARLYDLAVRMNARLAELLAAETGAAPGDPLPELVASQIGWLHGHLLTEIGRGTEAGRTPDDLAEDVLALLDVLESLLGERVLTYAVR
ncbi:TetR/AcrR family transcriptional regulator [Actinomadura roseirufa]|uniref:TetR/AcrR family transcriptional regulator n=1 Tax=Actinomadura roseirufa TaxID=2094049 RepID=UPI00104125BD|nr:TetR/AcrR family transcriptional regulator [Actinomadura roseirufa]